MSWDGELPEGWTRATMETLGEVRLGRQRSPERATGPFMRPYMRAANVKWAGIDLSDVKEMDFTPDEAKTFQLRTGDVLVGEASGGKFEVGKSAVWRDEVPGACFQNTLIRVRSNGAAIPEYLKAHLTHDALRGALAEISRGVGIHHLSARGLAEWEIDVPPLNEQRRIVAKIEALTARSRRAKEALDAVPPLLEKLRQSILAAAFRGDLTADWRAAHPDVEPASELLKRIRVERRRRWEDAELAKMKAKGKPPTDDRWKAKYEEPAPVDDSELPELPEGWAWASLDETTVLSGGITKGQRRAAGICLESVPYLRVANVQRGHLDLTEVSEIDATPAEIEAMQLQPGDILLNEGGDRDKLGRGWVWGGQLPRCIHQNHVFRARPVSSDVQPEIVSHFTNTYGQDYFLDQGKQTTNLASVSMSRVRRCPLPIPPRAESVELVLRVRAGLAKLGVFAISVKEGARFLEGLDSSILAKAFRGELVPQDPNDEPASALLERIRASSDQEPSGKVGGPRKRSAPNR